MSKTVALVMGGRSREREVSLDSGANVVKSLKRLGYRVRSFTLDDDPMPLWLALQDERPLCLFNALHGRWGEDGCIQGACEVLNIAYTHSPVLASAIAMDKLMTQRLLASIGITCPDSMAMADHKVAVDLDRPYVIKPVAEGSSVGVRIIVDGDGPRAEDFADGHAMMAQAYISGRELTVAVLDGQALGIMEIEPCAPFYDYMAKYSPGGSDHIVDPSLPDKIKHQALDWAARGYTLLGCRGVARMDLLLHEDGQSLYALEINTQPGMTEKSLVPEIAAAAGINFDSLVSKIVDSAIGQR